MPRRASKKGAQPFAEHLNELRARIVYSVLCIGICAGISYSYKDWLFEFLLRPLNQPLYYTSPMGGFDFLLKVCLFSGFILSVPILVYHLLRFLEPLLSEPMRFKLVITLFSSWILVLCGVSFAYFVSLPATLHFLNEFTTTQVKSLISTQEYFSFILVYLAGFAVIFQLPLILLFLNSINPLSPRTLFYQGKIVIVIGFVAAAIITPTPDPFNQTIMAVPIILLYFLSVLIIWAINTDNQPAKVTLPPPPAPPRPRRVLKDLQRPLPKH